MIQFTADWAGHQHTVTWDKGTVAAEPMFLDTVRYWAEGAHRYGLQGGPYFSGLDILTDAWATYLLLYAYCDAVKVTKGKLPNPAPLPKGKGVVG